MKVLLTGVNGFIGASLLPLLLDQGHEVWGCLRRLHKSPKAYRQHPRFHAVEIDFIKPLPQGLPMEFDVAYYLIHSLGKSLEHFYEDEEKQASHFVQWMTAAKTKQVIYLSGITHPEALSDHLASRKNVGDILRNAPFATTTLRAAIIVGARSASFRIMKDLVTRLPVMVAPDSLLNDCQPIALDNVLHYLIGVMGETACYNQVFDIGGEEIISYKDMLMMISDVMHRKRWVITVPWISPRFEARWFYFITSAPYRVAVNLANSMQNKVICSENRIRDLIQQDLLSFRQSVIKALA